MGADPRWAVLEKAQAHLIASLANRGVTRVEFVAWRPDLVGVTVWLCTDSDAERDALDVVAPAKNEVEEILRGCGLDDRDLGPGLLGTTAESQQTVDREYRGSWFLAMR